MPKYKIFYGPGGEERNVSFVCQRCGDPSHSECSFDTYNRPYHTSVKQPGACTRCQGTGFDPQPIGGRIICAECEGTAICPNCTGHPYREWFELPGEIRESFLQHWEPDDAFRGDYGSILKFYRNY